MSVDNTTKEIISRNDAKALGLKRYFSGTPCKHGHVAERYVNSWLCVVCDKIKKRELWAENPQEARAKIQKWKLENKERNREHRRKYYAAHKEKSHEKSRKWKELNPEKAREISRTWDRLNREKRRAYSRTYVRKRSEQRVEAGRKHREMNREKYREYYRNYYAKHPERWRADNQTRRARKRGAEGRHTIAEINALLERQNHRCVYCKNHLKNGYHADHIVPLSKDGSNWIANIQILCPSCNLRKNAADPIVFAQRLGLLL